MRRPLAAALPLLVLLAAAGGPPSIQIDHPWARASAGAATTGAAYMTLTDTGAADRLIGVSTPAASVAEVHETMSDSGNMSGMSGMGGMTRMRPLAGGLELPAGKPVKLAPGGYHVMMTGLKAPLKAGDSFPLTLTFQHAPPQTVTVTVRPIGAKN